MISALETTAPAQSGRRRRRGEMTSEFEHRLSWNVDENSVVEDERAGKVIEGLLCR